MDQILRFLGDNWWWLLLLLPALFSLLERLTRPSGHGSGGTGGGGPPGSSLRDIFDPAAEERRLAAKGETIREVARADPLLAQELLKMAGQEHRDVLDLSRDEELVKQVARAIKEQDLEALKVAATQQEIVFDLKRVVSHEPVNYPTKDIRPEQMTGLHQLTEILPEQHLLDDETFFAEAAENRLLVMQPYEMRVEQKLLYILMDVSGSMDYTMSRGQKRHIWARGVAVNLLVKAVRGEARYFFRTFDGAPHDLMQALTPEEAKLVMHSVLRGGLTNGGTNIYAAFAQAVEDIRSLEGFKGDADILLITDGEDHSVAQVQEAMQNAEGIRLHVVIIGNGSEPLQKAATSYRTFN